MLNGADRGQIETAVHDSIRTVLAERGDPAPLFDATTRLNAQLGLTSLDLAVLVAELDATLGLDPFVRLVPVTSVRSVGDVVEAYWLAATGAAPAADGSLADAAERAQRRRARRLQQ